MKHRFLAVDMGNTSVTFGAFSAGKLVGRSRVLTHVFKAADIARLALLKRPFEAALVSSVVPSRNAALERALRSALGGAPVRLIGRDVRVPVGNKAKKPSQVGMDRLVNAYEAFARFRKPCIAVDFGTAVTFDVVSAEGDYAGGVIAPGIELTLNALFEKTALLPKIRLLPPSSVLGKTTEECIRSGCSFGLGALCDGILRRLRSELKTPFKVIATGGYAPYMARYSREIRQIDPDLNLKGIHRVWVSSRPD